MGPQSARAPDVSFHAHLCGGCEAGAGNAVVRRPVHAAGRGPLLAPGPDCQRQWGHALHAPSVVLGRWLLHHPRGVVDMLWWRGTRCSTDVQRESGPVAGPWQVCPCPFLCCPLHLSAASSRCFRLAMGSATHSSSTATSASARMPPPCDTIAEGLCGTGRGTCFRSRPPVALSGRLCPPPGGVQFASGNVGVFTSELACAALMRATQGSFDYPLAPVHCTLTVRSCLAMPEVWPCETCPRRCTARTETAPRPHARGPLCGAIPGVGGGGVTS